MLKIKVEPVQGWNSVKEEFVSFPGGELELEHSLISLSKWEAKWHKPFISEQNNMSDELFMSYVKCMTVVKHGPDDMYDYLTRKNMTEIQMYMLDPHTATTFQDPPEGMARPHGQKQILTSEVIYQEMVELGIPFECEKWHLNRLLTLIRVCVTKQQPSPKMSKRDTYQSMAALNAARRAKMHSKG